MVAQIVMIANIEDAERDALRIEVQLDREDGAVWLRQTCPEVGEPDIILVDRNIVPDLINALKKAWREFKPHKP